MGMKSKLLSLFTLLLLMQTSFAEQKIVGNVSSWGPDPTLEQIDAMTHMVLCFVVPDGVDGSIRCTMEEERMVNLVSQAHSLGKKAIISFGGGSVIIGPDIMEHEDRRKAFVSNMINFVEEYGFDGIESDWEPDFDSSPDDSVRLKNNRSMKATFNTLLSEMRDSLDTRFGAGTKSFSAAITGTNVIYYYNNISHQEAPFPEGFWEFIDYASIMCYGVTPGKTFSQFDDVFGPNGCVEHWVNEGLPKEKMLIGIPFYGQATWSSTASYADIVKNLENQDASTAFLNHDFGAGAMDYGFSSVEATIAKRDTAEAQGMQGVFFWETYLDAPLSHPMSLLKALTNYETTEKVVTQTESFDTLITTSEFTHTVVLSDYFDAGTASIEYSLYRLPNRHSALISNDTLYVTGDSIADVGITAVSIKAERADSKFDYLVQDFTIVVDERTPIQTDDSTNANWVISQEWHIEGYADQLMLPTASSSIKKVDENGDTCVHFIGTLLDQPTWNAINLSCYKQEVTDISNIEIFIDYKSDIEGDMVLPAVIFMDVYNKYHAFRLKTTPEQWISDTITTAKLTPGWEQPDEIDYTQIKTIAFDFGGVNNKAIYNFSLKRYEPRVKAESIQNIVSHDSYFSLNSVNSMGISFKNGLTKAHKLSIFDARGRAIETADVTVTTNGIQLKNPLAHGVYFLSLAGEEIKRSWKVTIGM